MAETRMRMAIDPFKVIGKALVGAKKQGVPRRVVSVCAEQYCHKFMNNVF